MKEQIQFIVENPSERDIRIDPESINSDVAVKYRGCIILGASFYIEYEPVIMKLKSKDYDDSVISKTVGPQNGERARRAVERIITQTHEILCQK